MISLSPKDTIIFRESLVAAASEHPDAECQRTGSPDYLGCTARFRASPTSWAHSAAAAGTGLQVRLVHTDWEGCSSGMDCQDRRLAYKAEWRSRERHRGWCW